MTLVLFNTLNNKKEPFVPVADGKVLLYVCGPTVYDHSHIGHARAVIVFDVLVRLMERLGYDVTYIRNFTDLDDKIINRANEAGEDYLALAQRFIDSFHEDMDALGAKRPTREPRATEFIELMIKDIEALVESGHAYPVDGDVYFDVGSYADYGKLSGRDLEDMQAGARVQVDERKKNPWDFALWKQSKPGEPAWVSPWGNGRPGWHIECSTMSNNILGSEFDIHGGGHDLVFPHHENEVAQSRALGRKFARVWMHNGFVRVDHEKMSKSLGNFFTVKEVLAKYPAEVIRLFLVSNHYRGPIDFSDEGLEETRRSLNRAYRALKKAADAGVDLKTAQLSPVTEDLREKFVEAMNDDLNTSRALGHLFEAVKELNRLASTDADPEQMAPWVAEIRSLGDTLGILSQNSDDWFALAPDDGVGEGGDGLTPEKIEAMIEARAEARKQKNWAEADRIRDELKTQGIVLEDAGGKTTWRVEA
jgi:cysteinyl-tRNA synthetase